MYMARETKRSASQVLSEIFDRNTDGEGVIHTVSDDTAFSLDPNTEVSIVLLHDLLVQQKITNMHLSMLTNEVIVEDDIEE